MTQTSAPAHENSDRPNLDTKRLMLPALLATVLLAGITPALGQSKPLTGSAAFGDWRADRPGLVRLIRPADLPKPGATASSASVSRVVPRPAAAMPQVPDGFKVERLAGGLSGPRKMTTAPNGDVFVSETHSGRVRVLRLSEDGAKVIKNETFASGLDQPFGIAFFPSDKPQWVYIANTGSVVRFRYRERRPEGHGRARDGGGRTAAWRRAFDPRHRLHPRRQADAGLGGICRQRRGRNQR